MTTNPLSQRVIEVAQLTGRVESGIPRQDLEALLYAHGASTWAPDVRDPWHNLASALNYAAHQDEVHRSWDRFANGPAQRREGPVPALGYHGHGA